MDEKALKRWQPTALAVAVIYVWGCALFFWIRPGGESFLTFVGAGLVSLSMMGLTFKMGAEAKGRREAEERLAACEEVIDELRDKLGKKVASSNEMKQRATEDQPSKMPSEKMLEAAAMNRLAKMISEGKGSIKPSLEAAQIAAKILARKAMKELEADAWSRVDPTAPFDEATYAMSKPLFTHAVANIKDASPDMREAMRAIVCMVVDKFGRETAQRMKPYIVRFIRDVRSGKIKLENHYATAPGNDPQPGGGKNRHDSPVNNGTVSNATSDAGQVSSRPVRGPAQGGARSDSCAGLSSVGAVADGKRGYQPICGDDGRFIPSSGVA